MPAKSKREMKKQTAHLYTDQLVWMDGKSFNKSKLLRRLLDNLINNENIVEVIDELEEIIRILKTKNTELEKVIVAMGA